METAPSGKGSRTDSPSELGFAIAPRKTDPIPAVTRSSEVSRVEPTSAMVTRSRALEGRGIGIVPEIEFRPETETRPEPEIQVSMSTSCEGGLGAARPFTTDTASQYVTAGKPKATATFATSLEINPNLSIASQTAPSHSKLNTVALFFHQKCSVMLKSTRFCLVGPCRTLEDTSHARFSAGFPLSESPSPLCHFIAAGG